MDTIERLDLIIESESDVGGHRLGTEQAAIAVEDINNNSNNNNTNISPISKYQQKKQRQLEKHERARNRDSIRNYKAVSVGDIERHAKISKRLYLSKNHSEVTVVCQKTGIVSIMLIPGVQGRVLETESPFADLSNARGLVQEGFEYLSSLDTQIVAGLFLTLSEDYELTRSIPSATGAENNAILRTAGKEKLVEACLMIERFINSGNHTFLPKLSLIWEGELKDNGCEPRFTEWMKLVNEAILEPDLIAYDENALLNKPMKSIKDLQKDHTREQKEEKRLSSLKDKNYKERAQFRKDMKEAKSLVKALANGDATKKLVGFLSSLFIEDTYLSIDTLLLGQVISKMEPMESASAKRIVEILKVDRSALRKEVSIDDDEDILFEAVAERSEGTGVPQLSSDDNEQTEDDEDYQPSAEDIEQVEMELEAEQSATDYFIAQAAKQVQIASITNTAVQVQRDDIVSPFAGLDMPPGLSLVQKIKWKKENSK